MKKKRSNKKPKCKKVPKKVYLEGIRERLRRDVEPYFELIKKLTNSSGIGVGFWSSARLIFPLIDAVSSRLYKSQRPKDRATHLLKKIGIEYPNLTWEMFRHSLIHGDQPRYVRYGGRQVNWGLSIGGNHRFSRGVLIINVEKIYWDFVSFLDGEIENSGKTNLWIEDGIKFTKKIDPKMKNEIKRLGRKIKTQSASK